MLESTVLGTAGFNLSDAQVIILLEAQQMSNMPLSISVLMEKYPEKQWILSMSVDPRSLDKSIGIIIDKSDIFTLHTPSYQELIFTKGVVDAGQCLEKILVTGMYPPILTDEQHPEKWLQNILDTIFYKDILQHGLVRKPDKVYKLMRLLAFQTGKEINASELSDAIGVDAKTITSYIDMLESVFLIFCLPSYNGVLKNEVRKTKRVYFYDNGIRNVLLGDFSPFNMRLDKEILWENMMIGERIKRSTRLKHGERHIQSFFWRTTQMQEIQYLEVENENITAFEFTSNPRKKARFSKTFTSNYSAKGCAVSMDNMMTFFDLSPPSGF
jgi:predicted AAA+ superfamily ATPase